MFGFLSRQAILSGIVVLIAFPFLIFYITSSRFLRRKSSNGSGKRPPTVPFYVPGVFHAFSLASIGPQNYLGQLLKEYHDDDPFFVFAGPQPFLIVRKPTHIDQVAKASHSKLLDADRIETFDKIYAVPQVVLDLYAGRTSSEAVQAALKHVHLGLIEEHLSGEPLFANAENYIAILTTNLNDKMFQVGSWTQIEDAWSFLRQVFTRCILTSLFGSDLIKLYPGVIKDYWEFSEAVEGFMPGMPRYWVPGAAVKVRERLYQGIGRWLKANHSGSEFARIADGDPIWDELKGSKFVQERDDELSRIEGIDMQARVADMLSIMHASTDSLVPCMIWSMLELSRRPQVAQRLTADVSRYSPSRGATYNVADVTRLPLMASLEAETRRLRIAELVVHSPTQDAVLDEKWTAPCGVPILTFTHDVAFSEEAWRKSLPRASEMPLHEYWPERFLVQGQMGTRSKGGIVGNKVPGVNGIESMNIGPSDVCQRVLGSAYAKTMHAATLAVLTNDFEIGLCDAELFDQIVPSPGSMAFGTLKPLGEVSLRIRKRSAP